jgi:modulator of FtsH protease HflK
MRIFILLLAIVLLGYLATGFYQVGPDERAIIRRFGQVVARPGPGLGFGFPAGIDRVDRVQVRTVRQLDVGFLPENVEDSAATPPGQFLTGDQNLVNIKLVVEYAIDDRESELEAYLASKDRVDSLLIRELEGLVAEWVAAQSVDDVLLTARAVLPRWLLSRLEGRLEAQRLGILVQRLSVDTVMAPIEVREAFEAVNQAQTAIRTREYQAEQDAEQRQREAMAQQFKLMQQAEAYRTEKKSFAIAEAEGFKNRLEQYQRLKKTNPDILKVIWWEEMGRMLIAMKGRGRIDILDDKLAPNGLDITQFLPPKKK